MPLLAPEAASNQCTDDRPCPPTQRCSRCEALLVLTPSDWVLIGFYRRVADQYINQTPMGVKDGPPITTPRLEGYEAALRLYGYDRCEWSGLVDGAVMLHRLAGDSKRVLAFLHEQGLRYQDIQPEDVIDGD